MLGNPLEKHVKMQTCYFDGRIKFKIIFNMQILRQEKPSFKISGKIIDNFVKGQR